MDFMRGYYGPLNKAFGALEEEGQNALEQDLISLVERYNRSEDGTVVLARRLPGSRGDQALGGSHLQTSPSAVSRKRKS